MADQNDNTTTSNEQFAGTQQNSAAVQFDEQTVLSRGQAQTAGAGENIEKAATLDQVAEDSSNENIQTTVVGNDVRNRLATDQGAIHDEGLGVVRSAVGKEGNSISPIENGSVGKQDGVPLVEQSLSKAAIDTGSVTNPKDGSHDSNAPDVVTPLGVTGAGADTKQASAQAPTQAPTQAHADAPKATDAPHADAPKSTDAPQTDAPKATDAPHTDAPKATDAPHTDAPKATDAPHTDAPKATDAPHTDAPQATDAPHTDAPQATDAPHTDAPHATDAPHTDAPHATDAPHTDAPHATDAPHTDAPHATDAPHTDAPHATDAPHTDAPQATDAPHTEAPSHTDSSSNDSGSHDAMHTGADSHVPEGGANDLFTFGDASGHADTHGGGASNWTNVIEGDGGHGAASAAGHGDWTTQIDDHKVVDGSTHGANDNQGHVDSSTTHDHAVVNLDHSDKMAM